MEPQTIGWSPGIMVERNIEGAWRASLSFHDPRFADGGREIVTTGTLTTSWTKKHSDEASLTAAINTLRSDAQRIGVVWSRHPGPTVTAYKDGRASGLPEDWRKLVNDQAKRLGWRRLYPDGNRMPMPGAGAV